MPFRFPVARDVGGVRREAHVSASDLDLVCSYLADPPGGIPESPAAGEGLFVVFTVVREMRPYVFSDEATEAFHWALERMMGDGLVLSAICTTCET